jgi:hypothetical protein
MSGRLVSTMIKAKIFQRLAVELPLEWMSCIASPAAVCPSGNGIRDHPSIAECGLRVAEFLMSSCFGFNYSQFEFRISNFEICFLGYHPINKIYAIVDMFDDCHFILLR